MYFRWRFSVLLLFLIIIKLSKCALKNNVCSTIRDYFTKENNTNCWYNFAAQDRVPDIIKKTGYPFIEYKVQTKDGYILSVFRIPSVTSHRPPVFMMPGVECTSAIWVSIGRNSLAFLLADAGYDVWLGNYRGSEYSEGHTYLNISQKEYWNTGTDEIALIDVPTMIQLVTYHSGHKGKIIYIGHSLGTAAALMYSSTYPEHAKNSVQLFVMLSPSYTLSSMISPYRVVFPFLPLLLRVFTDLNVVQTISRAGGIVRQVCLASPVFMLTCLSLINIFLGPFTQIAPETIPVLLNQLPGGFPFKALVYITQAVRGDFTKYNYGSQNYRMYGVENVPAYNISKCPVPFYLMYASHDWCTTKRDALNLWRKLPSSVKYGIYEVSNLNFNHFDFVFGRNVKNLVYKQLFKVLNNFKPSG